MLDDYIEFSKYGLNKDEDNTSLEINSDKNNKEIKDKKIMRLFAIRLSYSARR